MFFVYFIIILIVPIWAQLRVKGTYKKYAKINSSSSLTGRETARKILDANGLFDVYIEETHGVLSDHYDPQAKVVRLSSENYHGHSLAAPQLQHMRWDMLSKTNRLISFYE